MTRPLDKALFNHLTNYVALERLIGTRLYPDLLPQNVTYPAIAYMLESELPEMVQQGPSGLRRAYYRFEIYGETIEDVDAIADAIENAMYGYTEGSPPLLPYMKVTSHETDRARDPDTMAFYRMERFTVWYQP
jgi:hypothetical protein